MQKVEAHFKDAYAPIIRIQKGKVLMPAICLHYGI